MFLNQSDFGFSTEQMTPGEGWHCSHFFYTFDRNRLAEMTNAGFGAVEAGKQEFVKLLDPAAEGRPARMQLGLTSGHKSDFSLMMMDPDPIRIESVHQALMCSPLGPAITPTWSYVSISEISEYALSLEAYRERLIREGEDPESSALETKVGKYAVRLEKMNFQRLTPNFPDWPVSCFYPMNKWRYPGANWLANRVRHAIRRSECQVRRVWPLLHQLRLLSRQGPNCLRRLVSTVKKLCANGCKKSWLTEHWINGTMSSDS